MIEYTEDKTMYICGALLLKLGGKAILTPADMKALAYRTITKEYDPATDCLTLTLNLSTSETLQ